MASFHARIYEADSNFYEGALESLIIPTIDGYYGVKAKHQNVVIALIPGIMKYREEGGEMQYAAVSRGMMRIEDGDVLILVDSAEHPDEIDAARAEERMAEDKEQMLQKQSIKQYYEAEASLRKQMARLRLKHRDEI